jgi:hypothetical protein
MEEVRLVGGKVVISYRHCDFLKPLFGCKQENPILVTM